MPLLGIDDRPYQFDLYRYLWDVVLSQTTNDCDWLLRDIASDGPDSINSLPTVIGRWRRLDDVYLAFDSVNLAIDSTATRTAANAKSMRATRLLRSIFQGELRGAEIDIVCAMLVFKRFTDDHASPDARHVPDESKQRLTAAIRRMARALLRLVVSRLLNSYQIL